MQVRYIGDGEVDDDGLPLPCAVFGQTFPVGEWVEVEDARLAGNPMFEAEGVSAPSASAAEQLDAPSPDGPEEHPETGMTREEIVAELEAAGFAPDQDAPLDELAELLDRDPLDHDGDGHKGGSLPSPEPGPGAPPENWRDLHWKVQAKLAAEMAGREVTTKADAVAILTEAEDGDHG